MVSQKFKNGIHLPSSYSNLIKSHIEDRFIHDMGESILVSDRALKGLVERLNNDFQGRRLRQCILEQSDYYTKELLKDIRLGSYDYSQDLIFSP